MYRRMPKRGFINVFAKRWLAVNVGWLAEHFENGAVIDLASLRVQGVARGKYDGIRILGGGELGHRLVVKASHVSETARKKIEAAGGEITTELGNI